MLPATRTKAQSNDKLQGVSALCSNGNSTKAKSEDLIRTDKSKSGLFQGDYGATQVSTVVSAGGSVASKPLKGNPNHCEISGLTVEKLKGVWSMCTAAGGCCGRRSSPARARERVFAADLYLDFF